MRTPPLLADFTHARPCKPFCENSLTLPSKGACLLARGHPAGAGAPCWSTALLAKSSVLDLLRPPGRERGCAGQHGHFPAPAEQRISAGGAACGYPLFLPPVGEPSKDDGAPGLGRRVAGAAVVVLRRVAVAGVYPRSLGSMRPSARAAPRNSRAPGTVAPAFFWSRRWRRTQGKYGY